MLIQATEILNKPVLTQKENLQVGKVSEVIVDPEKGRVVGFLIYQIFQKPKVVSEIDVLDLTNEGLLIISKEALISSTENTQIQEIFKQKIKILKSRAITESKKNLGTVEDFLIETDTACITKFYIKGVFLAPTLILPVEKVIKIEKGKIIFSDDILEGRRITETAIQ